MSPQHHTALSHQKERERQREREREGERRITHTKLHPSNLAGDSFLATTKDKIQKYFLELITVLSRAQKECQLT